MCSFPRSAISFPLAIFIALCQYVVMVCLQCGGDTQIINSRLQKRANHVWRRRRCILCDAVFSTEEAPKLAQAWMVQDATGRLHPFSRDKLFISLFQSLQHRPTAISDAEGLAETVIKQLQLSALPSSFESRTIAHVCQVALNRFDKAASTHYQAFHRP